MERSPGSNSPLGSALGTCWRVCLLLLCACSFSFGDDFSAIAESQRKVLLETLEGQSIRPLYCEEGEKFATVIFVTSDCPVANAYAPEIRRLASFITDRGGHLTLAHVDPERSVADAKVHADDYGLDCPIVIDRHHELVAATGATVTPEAALIAPNGRIVYRGRISDLFAGFGEKRREATTEDLKLAIEALLEGRSPAQARVKSVGCYIPGL